MTTVEEEEYPQFYHLKPALDPKDQDGGEVIFQTVPSSGVGPDNAVTMIEPVNDKAIATPKLAEGHRVFAENRKGLSYDKL